MAERKGSAQRSKRPATRSSRKRVDQVPVNTRATTNDGMPDEDLTALLEAMGTEHNGTEGATTAGVKAEGAPPMQAPVCSVALCPICMVVTAVGDARPDLIQHLLLASREVLLAVRSIIDARLEGTPEKPSRLERITVE